MFQIVALNPPPITALGIGSPEGNFAAPPGTRYWDTSTKSDWVKESAADNPNGWVQIMSALPSTIE